jgi:aminoglycoside 2''-phosphotransferase
MALVTDQQCNYVETIHTIYPGIDIRSAHQHTHDGQFNDILVVNDDLVFRFPRYAENIPGFLSELQLLAKLQARLPLPIPDLIYTSGDTTEPGKVFMGYRLIPGQPLYLEDLIRITDETDLQGLAKQLADFLSVLHHLTLDMPGLDLPVLDMPAWVRTFFSEVHEHLFSFMRSDACLALTEHFEHYFNTPDLQLYQPTIIHGDFGGSNILFDNNKISGILDFSGTSYSDPALDIAAVSTYGKSFFTRICQFYPVTESMLRRAKFYRSTFALEEALYGWKNDDKEAFESGMQQYL